MSVGAESRTGDAKHDVARYTGFNFIRRVLVNSIPFLYRLLNERRFLIASIGDESKVCKEEKKRREGI